MARNGHDGEAKLASLILDEPVENDMYCMYGMPLQGAVHRARRSVRE
jgi:hypothetical protein